MRFKVDHDLHIHSQLSKCSRHPQQTPENILAYALKNGFTDICLTDHFWDSNVPGASGFYAGQDLQHICQSLPLPQAENVRFHFGCETEMDKFCTVAISDKVLDMMDFIIVPVNHFHMRNFTIDEKDLSPERRADTLVNHIGSLLEKDLPFHKMGIAHLSAPCVAGTCDESIRGHLDILDMIEDSIFRQLFDTAGRKGIGIELNIASEVFEKYTKEEIDRRLRIYKIAKQCGCKFYLGSDAHVPEHLEGALKRFHGTVEILGLEETDKFDIGSIRRKDLL